MLHKITILTAGAPAVGFIDSTGAVVIEPRFYAAQDFREGRAGVHVSGGQTWGIIDERGTLITEGRYDSVGYFSEGLCAVRDAGGRWGFIDTAGKMVTEPRIRNQWPLHAFPYFSDGLCAVPSDDGATWGYCDRDGKIVIAHQFAEAAPFSSGRAVVRDAKGRASYIDQSGKPAFDGRWTNAWPFAEGVAAIEENKVWGIIDASGKVVHPPEFVFDERHAPLFPTTDPLLIGRGPLELHHDRSLFRTEKKKWGYVSSTGEIIVAAVYDKAGFFSDGLAPVLKKVKGQSRWGVIDTRGALVIDHTLENIAPHCIFADGLLPVGRKDGYFMKWGFIDRAGVEVVPPRFDAAYSFRNGLALVQTGDSSAYVNTRGDVVWSAKP